MDFFQHRGLLSRPLPTDQTAKLTGIQHPIAVTITACVLALSVYFQLASAHTLQYSILLIIITSACGSRDCYTMNLILNRSS
ncbi:hypothetical protein K491DRAFT_693171 [Lophiostoma macrostomum CBS 122681]|uniref:Uncharacterized protein n=1 Tax=Lophiostoma macrostomum CBS 122681 TaxID=1314788 RepID=A0A6A6T523_9PLEO|nr:hypothetical protein K491DRAFT_693171 [Lophiostoma macrostomum CBS 122681]